jgi:hypothetical protein
VWSVCALAAVAAALALLAMPRVVAEDREPVPVAD